MLVVFWILILTLFCYAVLQSEGLAEKDSEEEEKKLPIEEKKISNPNPLFLQPPQVESEWDEDPPTVVIPRKKGEG